jgi:hypothetical protein
MNPTRIPKEVLPPDWVRRDLQVTKGLSCILVEMTALRTRPFLSTGYYSIKYSGPYHPVQSAGRYRSLSVAIAHLTNISEISYLKKKFKLLREGAHARKEGIQKKWTYGDYSPPFRHLFCLKIKIWRHYFPNAMHDEIGRTARWRGVPGKKIKESTNDTG